MEERYRTSSPSIKPDTQQNYVPRFCSSWIKAVKEREGGEEKSTIWNTVNSSLLLQITKETIPPIISSLTFCSSLRTSSRISYKAKINRSSVIALFNPSRNLLRSQQLMLHFKNFLNSIWPHRKSQHPEEEKEVLRCFIECYFSVLVFALPRRPVCILLLSLMPYLHRMSHIWLI